MRSRGAASESRPTMSTKTLASASTGKSQRSLTIVSPSVTVHVYYEQLSAMAARPAVLHDLVFGLYFSD